MTTYSIPKGIASRRLSEEFFLLSPRTSTMHTLNETGADMLELLLAGHTPAEIGERLAEEFDAPAEVITADVERIIAALLDKELLVAHEEE